MSRGSDLARINEGVLKEIEDRESEEGGCAYSLQRSDCTSFVQFSGYSLYGDDYKSTSLSSFLFLALILILLQTFKRLFRALAISLFVSPSSCFFPLD